MTINNEHHGLDISRRRLLRAATFVAAIGAVAGAGLAATSAAAGSKFSQAAAKYQPTPKGANRCANCSLYESAGNCKVVEGAVAPNGWCMLYAPKAG
jgi:hypothetical protein